MTTHSIILVLPWTRGAQRTIGHGVAKSQTQRVTEYTHWMLPSLNKERILKARSKANLAPLLRDMCKKKKSEVWTHEDVSSRYRQTHCQGPALTCMSFSLRVCKR